MDVLGDCRFQSEINRGERELPAALAETNLAPIAGHDSYMTDDQSEFQKVKFHFMCDSMPQIVWTARPDGWRDYCNRRWFEYTGATLDQSEGWRWKSLLHPDDVEKCMQVWNRSLATGEPYQVELRYRRAIDGGYRWHLGRACPLTDKHGRLLGWVGTSTDIQAYKDAEVENAHLRAELENRVSQRTAELERVNAKLRSFSRGLEVSNGVLQDFASVAAHDLQEPLRKVRAFGDRLKAGYDAALGNEGQDYLNRMLSAASRMQALIQDLLAYAKLASEGRPFVPVDLAQITKEVLSDLEERISETKAHIEIGDLPIIQADPVQMRQLLQNLIGNSLKFHTKGAIPIVRVSATVPCAPAVVGPCTLTVEDNGIGFDEKYLDRIFAVFQRLHGRTEYEGTGVGLAICRRIAQQHGGEITARSSPNHGSAFVVTLNPWLASCASCIGPAAAATSEGSEDIKEHLPTACGRKC